MQIMWSDKVKNDTLTIPEFIPVFNKIAGLNSDPNDYKLLTWKPTVPPTYTLPNASTTVIWWVKLATAPSSPTNPVAVWDNDPRLTKYFASWTATLGYWTSNSTIAVWFTPSYVRITASAGSNSAAFYTSWNKTGSSNWVWFDFQSWLWTTTYTSTYAVDVRRNWQKYESTISLITNQFVLNHNWSQFTTEIMWEAFA